MIDVVWVRTNVPSWKGRKGRLAAAKEGRKKMLDAIFSEIGFLLVMVVWRRLKDVELLSSRLSRRWRQAGDNLPITCRHYVIRVLGAWTRIQHLFPNHTIRAYQMHLSSWRVISRSEMTGLSPETLLAQTSLSERGITH